MANGSTYDGQGRLVTCEHATSRVVREEDGKVSILAHRFQGRELNSPNDVVVARDGTIYFTDPTYGRQEFYGVPREVSQPHRGLYRLRTTGQLELMMSDFQEPNGLCFSLDEHVLFVNDSEGFHIRAFHVSPDGSLSGGEVWADLSQYSGEGEGLPDGMKIDEEGDIYCAGPGGVHAFGPNGEHLGSFRVPEVVGNLCWGGPDRLTLFVCASTSLYRMITHIPGHRPYWSKVG
jgi:gluconolactonase